MIILCLADIHQTTFLLKKAKEKIKYFDKVICLGDYVDSFESLKFWNTETNNPVRIIQDWVDFKKDNFDKVDLLLGNHDLSYISPGLHGSKVSGHQFYAHDKIKETLLKNLEYFDIVKEYDGWAFSHAGLSKTYYKKCKKYFDIKSERNFIPFLNSALHKTFTEGKDKFMFGIDWLFDWAGISPEGNDPVNGPTWIRPEALIKEIDEGEKPLFGKQVFGHTELRKRNIVFTANKQPTLYVCIDTPGHDNFLGFDTKNLMLHLKSIDL